MQAEVAAVLNFYLNDHLITYDSPNSTDPSDHPNSPPNLLTNFSSNFSANASHNFSADRSFGSNYSGANSLIGLQLLLPPLHLILHAHLESGAAGHIFQARDRHTNKVYAVKYISSRYDAQQEYQLQSQIKSPYILPVIGICEVPRIAGAFIVMPLGQHGDLFTLLQENVLTIDYKLMLFRQILMGIAQLHQNGIFHRDIKPENILIFLEEGVPIVKICDFGLATTVLKSRDSNCGTERYMAPEVLQGQPYSPQRADIWSLGVLLFTMLANCSIWSRPHPTDAGYTHFITNPTDTLAHYGLRGEIAQSLLNMLEREPRKRHITMFIATGIYNK